MKKTEDLFAAWEAPMVRACLQGHMGRVHTRGEDSALASIGDFCFLAGEPSTELLELADAPILTPGSGGWERLIRARLGERAVPFTRYAVRPGCFDRSRLIVELHPQAFQEFKSLLIVKNAGFHVSLIVGIQMLVKPSRAKCIPWVQFCCNSKVSKPV